MGIKVLVVSNNIALWDYINTPNIYTYKYIGELKDSFEYAQKNIVDRNIRQFMYISADNNTIFNFMQIQLLKKEINEIKKLNIIDNEDLETITKGINIIFENQYLYLKFEYD